MGRFGVLVITLLNACGRIAFDPLTSDGDGGGGSAGDDSDGDGVADPSDNCPGITNVTQDNEDGDRFGDACDPCPPFSDDGPIDDPDTDGVSGACDPFPAIGGDAIALFEGFSNGIPASAELLGAWTFTGGAATIVGSTNSLDAVLFSTPSADAVTVSGGATIDDIFGTGIARGAGAVSQSDATLSVGIACVLAVLVSNAQEFAMTDNATLTVLDSIPATTTAGVSFTFVQTRRGIEYACSTSAVGTPLAANSAGSPANPRVGIRARSMSVRFPWVMIVTSP